MEPVLVYWIGVILAFFCILCFNVIKRFALGMDKKNWWLLLYFLSFIGWPIVIVSVVGVIIWLIYKIIVWIYYSFKSEYYGKE